MATTRDFVIENGVLIKYTGKDKNVVIPVDVTSIGQKAFSCCDTPRSITIPDSVTRIEEQAFGYCPSLTSITIPDSITRIEDREFMRCYGLTNIHIPDSVTSIGDWAFYGCERLTSINIPDSVTSIGNHAFLCCEGLADKNGLVIVRGVLYWCDRDQQSVTIPDSVTSIGDSAFYWHESLTSISIPDSVISIGDSAFQGCNSLTNITIPNSVTSIGARAFKDCNRLQSITIPSALAKNLKAILPKTKNLILIHVPDISEVGIRFRHGAAVAFAEDNRDCSDENGKKYAKYIKANAVKLIDIAIDHPALFDLMLREKLIAPKALEAVTQTVQKTGNAEMIAAVLEYGRSSVSPKGKAKVAQRKET